jgi:hypothetical protein
MVNNNDIRDYAKEKYDFSPRNSHIAHAKEKYGLNVNQAHNRDGERKWPCPEGRLPDLKEIFIHFGLLKSKN